MPTRKRHKIYLAGPIAGCNPDQQVHWRQRVKDRWSREFDFIDPTETKDFGRASPSEIVRRDEQGIHEADAVLANMWKESIGTAIGVANARHAGKPVVVVDLNRLQSKTLAYYVDAVAPTVDAGLRAIRALLQQQDKLRFVIKRGGREEAFDRQKLVGSIRAASHAAGRNDLLVTAELVPQVLGRLVRSSTVMRGAVPTSAIKLAVWAVLREREGDPLERVHFSGIREAWERYDADRREVLAPKVRDTGPPRVHSKPLRVKVSCTKAHGTIWGSFVGDLDALPEEPRSLFREICRVDGVAEIRLARFSAGPKLDAVRAEIFPSKSEGVIEGKCYHNARKGQVQTFQIRVHDAGRTETIRRVIVEQLANEGFLKGREAHDPQNR